MSTCPVIEKTAYADPYALILERIDGRPMRLARRWRQVLLVVNVASRGEQAAQLTGLQELHDRFYADGLRVMGFPCNDFGGREPEAGLALQKRYERLGTEFELFSRVSLTAPIHPLFGMLLQQSGSLSGTDEVLSVRGNFEKFLVSREGNLLARFGPHVDPLAPELVAAIEVALMGRREADISVSAPVVGYV
jgi:glutathione peroxidase